MKTNDISDPLFRQAVEAIDSGNIPQLKELLSSTPGLATKRLRTPNEKGYFENPYLLWFVADNPIRHEKLPFNIVDVAQLIVDVMRKEHTNKYQQIIDYALGLVCTGRIPKECGLQIPLMEVLLKNGAQVKGSVLGPIGQRNFEAAQFLLDRGSEYNLATAVGFGRMNDIYELIKTASPSQKYVALVAASFFGKADVIAILIENGADVNGSGKANDFGGFHAHASALHQAVFSGSLESVMLLVNAGAHLDATDKAYNGTPLGWVKYMLAEEAESEEQKMKFVEIEKYLLSR